jgi:hypothetical protein
LGEELELHFRAASTFCATQQSKKKSEKGFDGAIVNCYLSAVCPVLQPPDTLLRTSRCSQGFEDRIFTVELPASRAASSWHSFAFLVTDARELVSDDPSY